MKKSIISRVVILAMATILTMGGTVFAYSKNFSYTFNYAVYGSTDFKLGNKDTNVELTANTYYYSGGVATSKNYNISLHKENAWFPTYKKVGTADGSKKTVKYGKLSENTYNVDLKADVLQGAKVWYIDGKGTVKQ